MLCEPVAGVCELLGLEPLFLACEGRVVAVVESHQAPALLRAWQALPEGLGAAAIGTVVEAPARVVLEIELGEWGLQELEDDPLPRIC